jgi:hypothetical protein
MECCGEKQNKTQNKKSGMHTGVLLLTRTSDTDPASLLYRVGQYLDSQKAWGSKTNVHEHSVEFETYVSS